MDSRHIDLESEAYTSSSKYETLITTGKLGGWEFNFKTGEFWCSREYFEMLDRAVPNMPKWELYPLQTGWIDLLHPDDLQRAQDYFKEYLSKLDGLYEQTLRMQKADGSYCWILCRAQALRDKSDNNPTGLIIGTHIDITKNKLLEIELEASKQAALKDNALLRSILNSPVDVYVVALDKNYHCITFTDAYKAYVELKLGKTIEVGTNVLKLFADHIQPIMKEAYDRALTGESFTKNLELAHDKVNITYNENRYSPIIDEYGKIIGLTAIVQDVTEAKKLEISNRLNELRYSAIFTGASDAIFIANAKTGIIEDANLKACELIGYEKSEIIGMHQMQLHPESELAFIQKSFQEFTSDDSYHSVECHALHKSGAKIPVLITSGSTFQIGEQFYIAGYFKNLSQVKEAESKVESTLALLSNAENISHTGSVEINMLAGSRIWSDELFRILGYEPGEVKPERELFISKVIPAEREQFINWQEETLGKSGKAGPIEVTILRKDGLERVLLISGMTYCDETGTPYKHIAVLNDITERHKMLKDLEKQNKQLLEIAWSQSHLVRAPLSKIMGLASAIQNGIVEEEKLSEFLHYMQESALELDKVIRHISNKTNTVKMGENESDGIII
jgi:PAS domain S-box-containing protein